MWTTFLNHEAWPLLDASVSSVERPCVTRMFYRCHGPVCCSQLSRRCLVHPSSSTQGFLVALEITLITLLGRCYSPSPITHLFKRSHSRWLLSQATAVRENKHRHRWTPPLCVSFQPSRCPLSHHQHEYHPHSPFSNSVVGTIIYAVWWKSGYQSVPVLVTVAEKLSLEKVFGGLSSHLPCCQFWLEILVSPTGVTTWYRGKPPLGVPSLIIK